LQKSPEYDGNIPILERVTINSEYGVNCYIFTVLLLKIKYYLYDNIFKNNIFLNT